MKRPIFHAALARELSHISLWRLRGAPGDRLAAEWDVSDGMPNPIVRKLELFSRLSAEDKTVLSWLSSARVRQLGSREDVIREGEQPREIGLFLSGWACRYKQMADGRRQIVAYCLPGDLSDLNVFIVHEMDHSIGTITPVSVAEISRDIFDEITSNHPRIAQALWWESLVNASVQRQWTVNLGQRSAIERVAHLFCELFLRLQSIGLTEQNTCEWPIAQTDLADTTGMTSVHVSRIVQELRNLGLVRLRDHHLTISDLQSLARLAFFNPSYLHLQREKVS